jgi:hypothetical protein
MTRNAVAGLREVLAARDLRRLRIGERDPAAKRNHGAENADRHRANLRRLHVKGATVTFQP